VTKQSLLKNEIALFCFHFFPLSPSAFLTVSPFRPFYFPSSLSSLFIT